MNPVIFSIGNFEIRWYSVILLVAFLVASFLINKEAKKFGIEKDFIFNMLFWALIFGLVGARIYYVIFDWEYFGSNLSEIWKVWNGGLAIHGGIIAGLLTIIVYTKKYNLRVIRYLDFIVVGLIIGQSIGRWGNFFNGEAHGLATSLEHLENLHIPEFIINGMQINGVYYTPTFLYESLCCLIGFIFLLIIRRNKYIKVGTPTAIYLIIYGIIRFFIERVRTDALMIGGFRIAIIVSVIMVIIGIIMLIINSKKGKFEDLYNDKNNIDVIKF
ncbi:MAG: prolipoprotein diacylglyceryl transferase [Bacilli bacterium]|nr:prolipoprotein diacylglyceryl transferase [Bacilli bacterium]